MSLNRPSLSQQLLERQLKPKTKPRGVKASFQSEVSFRVKLTKIIESIRSDIQSILIPELKRREPEFIVDSAEPAEKQKTFDDLSGDSLRPIRERWVSPEFEIIAERLALEFVTETNLINARRIREDLNRFGINGIDPNLSQYLGEAIADNARLIKSIPEQYLNSVEQIVSTNVRAGNRSTVAAKLIQQQHGVTLNKAKFIARDQTAKINSDLSQRRQRAAGFEYFRWSTSKDIRVRNRHDKIAKQKTKYGVGIYRYDDPPLSDSGQPILPGHDYQCRCVAIPVLSSEAE